jgi:predicted ABC-type transport system involved in lysophospholipase L1 biosynthesis ATPase subunit
MPGRSFRRPSSAARPAAAHRHRPGAGRQSAAADADEPTSQLDLETGRQIMRLLLTVVRSEGITALVATHNEALMDLADVVLRLEDGQIVS